MGDATPISVVVLRVQVRRVIYLACTQRTAKKDVEAQGFCAHTRTPTRPSHTSGTWEFTVVDESSSLGSTPTNAPGLLGQECQALPQLGQEELPPLT